MPARAWKNPRFEKLKTKWFYTQLGDAIGIAGRGMEVLPLQDEKGWAVGVAPSQIVKVAGDESVLQRREGSVENLAEGNGRARERRRSKRDSGILLMSPFSEHFKNLEEASKSQGTEDKSKSFDFERMKMNLEKVEKMMDQNAQQMRSLEHIQAANLERLTTALLHNAEMVQELARGQEGLVHACEELRMAVATKDESDRVRRLAAEKAERERTILSVKAEREMKMMVEKAEKERKLVAEREMRIMVENAEKERKLFAEREMRMMVENTERERKLAVEREKLERKREYDEEKRSKRSRSKEAQRQPLTRSQSIMSTATQDTVATLSPCGHVVRRAPRKLGRQVVGYIYANEEHQDVAPIGQEKRRPKGS